MKNLYLPVSIIIGALIITGALIYTRSPQEETLSPPAPVANEPSGAPTVNTEGHTRGNPDAPVTIVEYSDFQCPFCQKFHPTMQQILADYPDQVRWAYKHFPLDQIHAQARPAAEASECAAEQGKFWEFADGLFENQSRLGNDLYQELASELELDVDQFGECVSSRKYKEQVEAGYQEGVKAGVKGTPHSFVNGERVSGAVPYETLKTAVDRALSNL